MAERLDRQMHDWPLRPWLMAVLCALAGLFFHLLTDHDFRSPLSATRQAGATFVAVATLSFIITVERIRWSWALAFALGWGAIIALVGWFSASYNRQGDVFEWPFLAGIFAVLLAAPLFQTIRDEGRRRLPYRRLHSHAWTDAVIGAASLLFTGITFLMSWLIASLFDLIGIGLLKDLLEEDWFAWMLAGFAFGGAVGLLRERDGLAGTLQRLAMVVLSVLAPVLAFALLAFLLSIPFTGLQGLWESWLSATALLLVASAGAVLLANAVIGDGAEDRSDNRLLRLSALALVAVVLPLAILAAFAMGLRVSEYGWTPERIWGVVAIGVAIAYGIAGWWAIWRGRGDFDAPLRPMQTGLAVGLCGLALFLALPILDFGAISARSQVARLQSGAVAPERFDWAALAFDFGPAGRERLRELARSGPAAWRTEAAAALRTEDRWALSEQTRAAAEAEHVAKLVRVLSPGLTLTPDLLRRIAMRRFCDEETACAVLRIDQNRVLVLSSRGKERVISTVTIDLSQPADVEVARAAGEPLRGADLESARIELRPVTRRQVYVNGQPVGEAFE